MSKITPQQCRPSNKKLKYFSFRGLYVRKSGFLRNKRSVSQEHIENLQCRNISINFFETAFYILKALSTLKRLFHVHYAEPIRSENGLKCFRLGYVSFWSVLLTN